MKKRKIIPIITATFMAASLLIPNTALAVPIAPKPTGPGGNRWCPEQHGDLTNGNAYTDKQQGNMALTRMHYAVVKPGDARYNELLKSITQNAQNGVHCEDNSPIYATQTASGYFPAIDGKTKDSEVAITDPGNWVGGYPEEAIKRYVESKRKQIDYYVNEKGAPKEAFLSEQNSLNDIDPDVQNKRENEANAKKQHYTRANAVGLEAFCNVVCDKCEPPKKKKCKPGECEPPETIPRRYFLDYPEYKHDKASRSDVAQKDMPMSWTMFDNSAKGTDGYPLNIQYSKEDPPSDGHIEKDVVITPFGEMMNKLRQGIGDYAKFKNPAPSVEATNAYQQELIQRAIEHKNRTDKTKTGITIPKDHAISKALAKGGIVRVQKII